MSPFDPGFGGPITTDVFGLLTDMMAAQLVAMSEKMGTGEEEGSASLGARLNVDTIMALDDPAQVQSLLRYFRKGADKKRTDPNAHMLFEIEVKGLSFHVSGVNPYCSNNAFRVAPEFAEIHLRVTGIKLEPLNVFPPEIDNMGEFDVTAPDTGVFTDGEAVDTTKHGPAHLKVVTLTDIGAAAITATVDLLTFDGGFVSKQVVIPAGTLQDTEIDVGVEDDRYVDVTGITITGGTAGDRFKVKAPRERDLPDIINVFPT